MIGMPLDDDQPGTIRAALQRKNRRTALPDIAEEQARSWGVPEVRLYTNSRMERNIAIYTAYGFQETGRRANPPRPGWTVVDMAKPVGASTAA